MRDPLIPSFVINKETKITLTIPRTLGTVLDQGFTYNEATKTFNDSIDYAGVLNYNQDKTPILSGGAVTPHVFAGPSIDQYTPGTPGFSLGPGWFMFVTIPK